MWDFARATDRVWQLRRIVRRETVRLVVLSTIAVGVFLATRLLAERAEHLEIADAARWHSRGRELLATSPEDAATAFRRAVTKHRDEKRYVLALADALARGGNTQSALRALQGLREFTPEDIDVNLAMARLYRNESEMSTALRYYYHAIYGVDSTPERARELRLELVRMLLDAGDDTRAQSELIAATIEVPPGSRDLRIELAELFERAGNQARAAEQYRHVLQTAPADPVALAGIVRTTFALGDYAQVARYSLPPSASEEIRELQAVAAEIVSRDPLAPRLSAAERRRRLLLNVRYLQQRWVACSERPPAAPVDYPPDLSALALAARARSIGRDSEALEASLVTIDRLRAQFETRCGTTTPVDRAIAVIVRSHSGQL